MRHGNIQILDRHALYDGPLHAHHSHAELVFQRLSHSANPAVAEMVNIVNSTDPIPEIDNILHHGDHIFQGQQPVFQGNVQPKLLVHLDPANHRQIISLGVEEQVAEQRPGDFRCRRVSRAEPFVDLANGIILSLGFGRNKGIANGGIRRFLINVKNFNLTQLILFYNLKNAFGNLLIRIDLYLAGLGINDFVKQVSANQAFRVNLHLRRPGHPFQLLGYGHGNFLTGFEQNIIRFRVDNILFNLEPDQQVLTVHKEPRIFTDADFLDRVIGFKNGLGIHAKGLKQDGRWQFASAVNLYIQNIFNIKLEVHPGTPIRDNPRRKENLAAHMGFSLIMREKRAWRTVHLTHNDPLDPVYHKCSGGAHHRHFTKEYFLLLDFPYGSNSDGGNLMILQNFQNFIGDFCFCGDQGFRGLGTLNLFDNHPAFQVLQGTRVDINHFPVEKDQPNHYFYGVRIGKTFLPALTELVLSLVGDFLFTGKTYDSRSAEFLELAATAFPNTDLKSDILDTGIDIQVGNRKNVTKDLFQSPKLAFVGVNIPLQEVFE